MTGPPLIELRGVDAGPEEDPERVLLRDVTWTIAEGEWWAVCGAPASGKTALLEVAAGLSPAARGAVRILGLDPSRASEGELTALRRQIGFVFEGGGRLFGRLSVAENVALPLRYHGELEPDEVALRVEELLGRAGLERLAGLSPSRLSPVLQQRVALLRAVAEPVRVLFLDDPLSGLAPSHVRWWLAFLRELRSRRAAAGAPLTVVASGYEFAPWRDDADRFAATEDGHFRVLAQPPEREGHPTDAPAAPPTQGM